MGDDSVAEVDPEPSLLGCIRVDKDGEFEVDAHRLWERLAWRRREEERDKLRQDEPREQKKPRKQREGFRGAVLTLLGSPSDSPWWRLYEQGAEIFDDVNGSAAKTFRRNFRMPYASYRSLLHEIRTENWFPGIDDRVDACGRAGHPLELYVLGVLRVLGRYMYFKDLEEVTYMSENSHYQCPDFHASRCWR